MTQPIYTDKQKIEHFYGNNGYSLESGLDTKIKRDFANSKGVVTYLSPDLFTVTHPDDKNGFYESKFEACGKYSQGNHSATAWFRDAWGRFGTPEYMTPYSYLAGHHFAKVGVAKVVSKLLKRASHRSPVLTQKIDDGFRRVCGLQPR